MHMIAAGYNALLHQFTILLQILTAFDFQAESDRCDRKNQYVQQYPNEFLFEPEVFASVYIRVLTVENDFSIPMYVQIMTICVFRIRKTICLWIEHLKPLIRLLGF